jgi:hypothetical protein
MSLRAAARRIAAMSLLWLGFGVAAGVLTAPQNTPLGIAAGIVAGMIVLPPVGALLGAIGGRWKESMAGGTLGLAMCTAYALAQARPDAAGVAAFGLILGGLVGATVVTALYRLPRLVLGGVRQLMRSDDRLHQSVSV